MKKLIVLCAIFTSGLFISAANAQVSVNINIGGQPAWGPSGYDHADYYYMPDIETYYYIPQRQFIYQERGRWITARALPSRYSNYNLYNMHKVVINQPRPYMNHTVYRNRYASYRGQQQPIRDARRPQYNNNWDNDRSAFNNRPNNNGNGRGNAYGHQKGNRPNDNRGQEIRNSRR